MATVIMDNATGRGDNWYLHMARYNRWVNQRLFDACAALPDTERKRDLGAFFGSVHATLNHLLLTDHLWLARFTATDFSAAGLDQELFADFDPLRAARADLDEAILAFAARLTSDDLEETLRYTSLALAREIAVPRQLALLHWFNHQTHHRGQVTALLSRLGVDYGDVDLLMMALD